MICLFLVWFFVQGMEMGMVGMGTASSNSLMKTIVSAFALAGIFTCFQSSQRFGVALLYWVFALWLTAHALAYSFLRHPSAFDPLPDKGHNWMQHWKDIHISFRDETFRFDPNHIPDIAMNLLVIVTLLFSFLQKNRYVILRRFIFVHASMLLLRCLTVMSTNLPDAHPRCRPGGDFVTPKGDMPVHLGGGSSLSHLMNSQKSFVEHTIFFMSPGPTCGDMVFSGHTVVMTLCALTIHTYWPRTNSFWAPNPAKVAAWAVCLVGLGSIIATRLHYSIDVTLALYLTVTLWTSYHRIANDVLLKRQFSCVWLVDATIIYPVIQFMESGCDTKDTTSGITQMHIEPSVPLLEENASRLAQLRTENARLLEQRRLLKLPGGQDASRGSTRPKSQLASPLVPAKV